MADYEFATSEFADLAERLDTLKNELTADERAMLFAVFRMAGDYLKKHSLAASGGAGARDEPPQAGSASPPSGSVNTRLDALEARVRQLEARLAGVATGGDLEAISGSPVLASAVQLRTEGGGLPKLSDGFINSFRGGNPGRVMTADDVSVGVNVGVMF
jgi:hypothetical protein